MIFFVTYVCKIQTTCFLSSYKWTIKFAKTTKMTFPKTSMQGLLLLFIWFERMIMWSEAITCYSCNEFPAENFKDCSSNTTLVDFGHRKDACIIYQLDSGRVVFRAGVHNALRRVETNRCWKEQSKFKKMLQSVFNESGIAMCCQMNECNLSIDRDFIQLQNMLSNMDQRQREKFTEDTCGMPHSIFSIVNLYPFLNELRKSPALIGQKPPPSALDSSGTMSSIVFNIYPIRIDVSIIITTVTILYLNFSNNFNHLLEK